MQGLLHKGTCMMDVDRINKQEMCSPNCCVGGFRENELRGVQWCLTWILPTLPHPHLLQLASFSLHISELLCNNISLKSPGFCTQTAYGWNGFLSVTAETACPILQALPPLLSPAHNLVDMPGPKVCSFSDLLIVLSTEFYNTALPLFGWLVQRPAKHWGL